MDAAILASAITWFLAFVVFIIGAGFATGPQAGKVWSLGVPSKYPKGHVHEYDPTGEYTYKHQNPKFR